MRNKIIVSTLILLIGFLSIKAQSVQYLLIHIAGILADMQKVMIIRLKAGDKGTVLKHSELTLRILMVRVFAYLEVVHLLVLADRDRVIFNIYTTNLKWVCLG